MKSAIAAFALAAGTALYPTRAEAAATVYVLTVNSAAPASGVAITANPADNNAKSSGTSAFTLSYNSGTSVVLTAPAKSGTSVFSAWTGCTSVATVTCTVTVNANTTVTATYAPPPKVTPTVTVNISPIAINALQSLAVRATLTAPTGDPVPAGTVVIASGSYTSAAATLSNGIANFNIPAGTLAIGADTLTATYIPAAADTATYTNAVGTKAVTVSRITPVVDLTFPAGAITAAESLAAKVTIVAPAGDPIPAGIVTLAGGRFTSAATALVNGVATFTIPPASLTAGADSLVANYSPSAAEASVYSSASSTIPVKVVASTPTAAITLSSASITAVQPVTAKIAITAPSGAPIPQGTVQLTSGAYASATTTLSAGAATIVIPAGALALGTESLLATYTPSSTYSALYTTAATVTSVRVTTFAPTPTVTLSAASITSLQPLTVKVAITTPAGAPVPAGSVTLTSGKYSSTATSLSGGDATITISASTLALGTDSLIATFAPSSTDAAIYGNASATTTVQVNGVAPTLTLKPASTSITTAQSLSVTIATAAPTGGPVPAGTVVLSSGSYASAATALTSGAATITIPAAALATGTGTLTAAYTPSTADALIYSSASATTSITVTSAALVTPTVTVMPAASTIGAQQAIVVKAVVSAASGDPTPTGTVTLTSGTYTSAAQTLSSGAASITVPAGTLPVGSDVFKASYTPTGTSTAIYSAATGTSSAVTVSAQSLISVNLANPGPAISDKLLGVNMAYWYDQSTPQIVSALQTAGIKAIRWPGGSGSDVYHWQTNSLCGGGYTVPADSFPSPLVTELWAPASLDVAITVNYGTNAACNGGGDPTEAAAWVTSALKNGNYVTHWTVGNEVYGSWETDMHTVKNDPTTYANAVATGYYPQMKAANANALVGVVVQPNNNPPWDPIVMADAKYDFVEYHYYPQAPGQESDTYLVHQAALDLTTNINAVKADLAKYGKASTPIYVGEIGSVYTDPGKQSSSITQALYAGQVLGELMNDGVSRATWWIGFGGCADSSSGNFSSSLYGWQNFGGYMIFSDGTPEYGCESATPTTAGTLLPTARAFQLFSQIAVTGENVLPAAVTGDTTDVRAYAATSSGGTALLLFNDNETTSESVLLQLTGVTSATSVTVTTYDKAIYDQSKTNVWAPPTTTSLGSQALPLSLTLTPWSMNVVIVK
jgi:hypothetical protein